MLWLFWKSDLWHGYFPQTMRQWNKSAKAEGNFALCFDYEEKKIYVKKNADYLELYLHQLGGFLYFLVGLAKELPLENPGVQRGNRL